MRIYNPPLGNASSIAVSKITPPSTFTTAAPLTVNAGSHIDIAADTTAYERFISNLDTAITIYCRDQSAITGLQGVPIPPGGTFILETQSALRLTNDGGSNVTVNVNSTQNV